MGKTLSDLDLNLRKIAALGVKPRPGLRAASPKRFEEYCSFLRSPKMISEKEAEIFTKESMLIRRDIREG